MVVSEAKRSLTHGVIILKLFIKKQEGGRE
jgi:hypothetical protein